MPLVDILILKLFSLMKFDTAFYFNPLFVSWTDTWI